VGDIELRIAIDDLDAGSSFSCASRIEHDAVNTSLFGLNDSVDQFGMREQEHLTRMDFFALLMASENGLAVSSGKTMRPCDILPPKPVRSRPHQLAGAALDEEAAGDLSNCT
jgi:hypothetical protein